MQVVSENRAVLITGASTGIGAAAALDLDRCGFRVFAGVRKTEDGERLRAQASERLTPVLIDVTDLDSVRRTAEQIAAAVGDAGLWGLVNNAGVAVAGPLELIPLDVIRQQFEVNVIGHIAVIQAMLPMIRHARGRIVNIGSLNGFFSPPFFAPYSATKYSMEAITQSLRMELKKWGIWVTIIDPANIATQIWDRSRKLGDACLAEASPESVALYANEIKTLQGVAESLASNCISMSRLLRFLRHSLRSRYPLRRYLVGVNAYALFIGSKFFPAWLLDWIVGKILKL